MNGTVYKLLLAHFKMYVCLHRLDAPVLPFHPGRGKRDDERQETGDSDPRPRWTNRWVRGVDFLQHDFSSFQHARLQTHHP